MVERGDVCLIGEGPDFFIAIGPHPGEPEPERGDGLGWEAH